MNELQHGVRILITVVLFGSSCPAVYSSPRDVRSLTEATKPHWRSPKSCGVSASYAFLRLLGHDVDFQDLYRAIPISANGSSLADVVNGCKKLGCEVVSIQSSPSEICNLKGPCIAHLYDFMSDEEGGHYVVLVGITESMIEMLDPSVAHCSTMPLDEFGKLWSGYLVVPTHALNASSNVSILELVVWLVLPSTVLGVLFYFAHGSSRIMRQRIPAFLLFLPVCSFGCQESRPGNRGMDRAIESAGSTSNEVTCWRSLCDLGVIDPDINRKCEFSVENFGRKSVVLSVGGSSCSCVKTHIVKHQLHPRSETTVVVEGLPAGRRGPFEFSVPLMKNQDELVEVLRVRGCGMGLSLPGYEVRLPATIGASAIVEGKLYTSNIEGEIACETSFPDDADVPLEAVATFSETEPRTSYRVVDIELKVSIDPDFRTIDSSFHTSIALRCTGCGINDTQTVAVSVWPIEVE